jgi:hypothetical protein
VTVRVVGYGGETIGEWSAERHIALVAVPARYRTGEYRVVSRLSFTSSTPDVTVFEGDRLVWRNRPARRMGLPAASPTNGNGGGQR